MKTLASAFNYLNSLDQSSWKVWATAASCFSSFRRILAICLSELISLLMLYLYNLSVFCRFSLICCWRQSSTTRRNSDEVKLIIDMSSLNNSKMEWDWTSFSVADGSSSNSPKSTLFGSDADASLSWSCSAECLFFFSDSWFPAPGDLKFLNYKLKGYIEFSSSSL